MILLALVLIAPGELVLKEKARVQGRWVRLADLLATPAPADVWLGRAPEEGKTRTIAADDIRRELELRGLAYTVVGTEVVVERGPELEAEALRRAVAFEIKRAVLERDGLLGHEVAVRLERLVPEPAPGAELKDVRPDGDGFLVTFADGRSRAVAQVVRLREVAFAVKDIPAGKTLAAEDVEIRRAEAGAEDVVGAVAAVRIRAGAPLGDAQVKRKPLVRKGELLRFVSAAYEVDARALEDGAPGREIDVEIPGTKARVRGRVAGAGRVEAK